MQPESLEKFIITNRMAFDDLEPGHIIWQRLEQRLNQKNTMSSAEASEILKLRTDESNSKNSAH